MFISSALSFTINPSSQLFTSVILSKDLRFLTLFDQTIWSCPNFNPSLYNRKSAFTMYSNNIVTIVFGISGKSKEYHFSSLDFKVSISNSFSLITFPSEKSLYLTFKKSPISLKSIIFLSLTFLLISSISISLIGLLMF